MANKRSPKKRRPAPKTVLRLPDLDQAKSAVLNSLSSQDAQRGYGSYPDNPLKVNRLCWISPLKGATLLPTGNFAVPRRGSVLGTLRNVRYNNVKLWSTAVEEKRIPVGRPDFKSDERR